MPKITDIKQQAKNKSRYSVYVDEKYTCSFSDSELLNLGLYKGQEFAEDEIRRLVQDSEFDKAYVRTLGLLARRPRSEWELRDYMKRKKFDNETQEKIIVKLSDLGYIDDLDFARRWVENRRLLNSSSKRRLQQELRQKRLSDDIIDQVLEEDETDERDVLQALIEKKSARYTDRQKLVAYLARQGFKYDDIRNVLDNK